MHNNNYDSTRPLAFFHIPKTGGSALRQALIETLKPTMANGWDRSIFGDYDEFHTMEAGRQEYVFKTADQLPKGAQFVTGHLAVSTIDFNYPDAQYVSIFRDPYSRLLSHWVFWRQRSEADLRNDLGTYAERIEIACQPLVRFLADPRIASQIDNVTTRLLLWPHADIPNGDFIPSGNEDALVGEAIARLDKFECADIYENPCWFRDVETWLGVPLREDRVNDTIPLGERNRTDLAKEFTPEVCRLLEKCSRLDQKLWEHVARKRLPAQDLRAVQNAALLSSVARFANLLRGA